ncbi:hemolysin family protein [Deminuibacter soli]|uniref:HlyC/CorC family transporter n=1 Tax=Deminuibacter soli TaxID=2291815 RepID=A0A3E1NRA7_9BACT|nr:hemolysin family protein [Deminuibacter soli]RFM30453.1 HlyC/CorC family transporter [Deminuibacter soli]
MTNLYTFLLIGCTLILIGFFAGIEIAFVSASRLNIELKKKQGKRSGRILSRFMEQPATFIGTCLVGINICMVVYGLLFSDLMKRSLWNPLQIHNEYLKLLFDTVLSSAILLLLGEFIPKAIFRAKNDVLLNFFAGVSNFFYKICYPIATIFVSISEWILKNIFNVRVKETNAAFSKVDLEHFFQQTKEQDEDNSELNTELFENALSLPMVKIRQCLVPRTEIEAVDIESSVDEVLRIFVESKLSKLVVYEENIDNILGFIHQLDFFKKPATIRSVMLPIPAVPESMSATDLINKFSKEGKSIAWVIDEFGGTAGIVTMEDVLEEIFGEIQDEYDTEEFVEKQLAENEYIFSGRLELDFLNEKYGFDFPENESETLSGYIINQYETIPKLKERIIIDRFEFDVLNVSDTRIEMVKMKVLR